MANLNFTLKEEDWYESQPIQLSTGKFAISINFGDAANNRVVVYKSSNGKDYVPYKTALGVGECCDMNVDGLIAGQYVMVGCNELPISSSFLESSDGSSSASKSDILAESGRIMFKTICPVLFLLTIISSFLRTVHFLHRPYGQ